MLQNQLSSDETSGDNTSSLPDCAADLESTDTIGTVDLEGLSDDFVQPVIQLISQIKLDGYPTISGYRGRFL
jgi:hypothetical protein